MILSKEYLIEDHRQAIELTEQALAGEINQAAWREALKPLLIAISERGDGDKVLGHRIVLTPKARLPLERPRG